MVKLNRWLYGKKLSSVLGIVLGIALVLAGCGNSSKSPKEEMLGALQTFAETESYAFDINTKVGISVSESMLSVDPSLQMLGSMFDNLDIHVSGVYQKEPFQMETTMDLALKGDLSMNFAIPLVMTDEKMWIKVPNIPMFPLPEDVVGKYVELDYQELAEMSEEDFQPDALFSGQYVDFSMKAYEMILNHFDEELYFTFIPKDEAELPEEIDAAKIIRFQLNDEHLEDFITVLAENIIPDFIELLDDPEYRDMFGFASEDLQQLKDDYEVTPEEIQETIDEIREALQINEISYTVALDKKQNMPYQLFKMDVNFKDGEDSMQFVIQMETFVKNINEEPTFEIGIPAEEEIITPDELSQAFMF